MRRLSTHSSVVTIYVDAIFPAVAIRISSYSILVSGAVGIPIRLWVRISVASIGIGVSVTAIAAIVAVGIVGITGPAAAVASCGDSRNQDSAQRHYHFSIVNRVHIFFLTIRERSWQPSRLLSMPFLSRPLRLEALPRLDDLIHRRHSAVRGIGRYHQSDRA